MEIIMDWKKGQVAFREKIPGKDSHFYTYIGVLILDKKKNKRERERREKRKNVN